MNIIVKIDNNNMLRLITEEEIEEILSFLTVPVGIPEQTGISIYNITKNRIKNQLKDIRIYPEILSQLKEEIQQTYQKSLIQPGESVGILCAQSMGERQTQMTLNTFHTTGQSEKAMTVGVPRFQELLNATKSPKITNCKVFFDKSNDSIQNLRNIIGSTIVCLKFKDIYESLKIEINKTPEVWYDSFKILYNADFTKYTDCISVKLKRNVLFEYKLKLQEIVNVLTKEYDDIGCVFSPPQFNQLDIFIDTTKIELPENRISFINTENAKEIYLEECIQPILEKIIICGMEGITNIYYTKHENEWYVETEGSNFKKLLAHPHVDFSRIISNNVWEIYETLGIEAAREFLLEEYCSIMDGINICHIKLLVERMTYLGTISSISRYTMRTDEAGPMGKASFEETMDNFLKAGAYGDIEPTNGVSASIICGKRANIGTGMMDIKIDIKKLPFTKPIIKQNVEETEPIYYDYECENKENNDV